MAVLLLFSDVMSIVEQSEHVHTRIIHSLNVNINIGRPDDEATVPTRVGISCILLHDKTQSRTASIIHYLVSLPIRCEIDIISSASVIGIICTARLTFPIIIIHLFSISCHTHVRYDTILHHVLLPAFKTS